MCVRIARNGNAYKRICNSNVIIRELHNRKLLFSTSKFYKMKRKQENFPFYLKIDIFVYFLIFKFLLKYWPRGYQKCHPIIIALYYEFINFPAVVLIKTSDHQRVAVMVTNIKRKPENKRISHRNSREKKNERNFIKTWNEEKNK